MNKEQAREITHELREYGYDTAACDEGLERQTALDAADLIESLQRERDERESPKTKDKTCDGCERPPRYCRLCIRSGIKDYYATEPKGDEAK